MVIPDSSNLIQQVGNRLVLQLYSRVCEIEALTRTLAATAAHLLHTPDLFTQTIPAILDFQADPGIAGGGVWFAPGAFAEQERATFYWQRDAEPHLTLSKDTHQADYHQAPWYASGRCIQPGQCVWSPASIEPRSQKRIITCTHPLRVGETFCGVVTVNLALNHLQAELAAWCEKTGGYLLLVDRNNQFLAFPAGESVVGPGSDRAPVSSPLVTVADFAKIQPHFQPIANMLAALDTEIVQQANQPQGHEVAAELRTQCPQMPAAEVTLLAATLTDALTLRDRVDYLWQNFQIESDWREQELAMGYLFCVPQVYWKLCLVKPAAETAAAAFNLIQTDKMASLGQMVTGIAHEINNPINFIAGNLPHAKNYIQDLMDLVDLYHQTYPEPGSEIADFSEEIDLEFLTEDLPKLLGSMQVGADRAREIALSLRNFARTDDTEAKPVDLHTGINNTLVILHHRLKAKSDRPEVQVIKDYGDLPAVECYAGQINQVVMNIVVNAIEAMEDFMAENGGKTPSGDPPTIRIQTTRRDTDHVTIRITDNGPGIPPDVQQRLFDPFFTTKPMGKGTGLGLSICRQIISDRHGGQLTCASMADQGAEFVIDLPIQQPDRDGDDA